MTTQSQSVLTAALALPEHDRAELVEHLLESLPLEVDEDILAELERRSAEFDEGTAGEISWSELKKEN